MGIISIEKANNLLWLGRYTERVYTTLRIFFIEFDKMIDTEEDVFPEFCEKLNIPNIYQNNADYVYRYIYDENNPDSVRSNLLRAYDNAIVLRDEIGTETMSYLQLCVDMMHKISKSQSPLLDLQEVLDLILAFWACLEDYMIHTDLRNIVKTGKTLERMDLFLRLGSSERNLVSEFNKLSTRLPLSGLSYNRKELIRLSYYIFCQREDYPDTKPEEWRSDLIHSVENLLTMSHVIGKFRFIG